MELLAKVAGLVGCNIGSAAAGHDKETSMSEIDLIVM
jgi:hypothetical protein